MFLSKYVCGAAGFRLKNSHLCILFRTNEERASEKPGERKRRQVAEGSAVGAPHSRFLPVF